MYTLDDCLALVRRQNPDVLAEGKRVDAARAAIITAKAGVYPAVTSTGYLQYREQSLTSEGGVNPTRRARRTTTATPASRRTCIPLGPCATASPPPSSRRTQEVNTYQAQIDTSTLAARNAFYQTLYAEATIGIRQEAVDLLGAQLKDQQDRRAAGTVGQLNVNRAQVSLANEQPALVEAQGSVQTAYVTLAQLLGVAYPADARTRPFRIRGELSCPPLRHDPRRVPRPRAGAAARDRHAQTRHRRPQAPGDRREEHSRPQVSAYAAYDIYSEPSILSARDSFSG